MKVRTVKIGKLFDGMLMLASVACMTLLGSCNKDDKVVESTNPGPGVYDMSVSDVGMYGAKLKAKVSMPEQMGTDFELGFELSESDAFPKESTKRYKVDNYNPDKSFSFELSDLKVNVTYHARAYMLNRMCLYTSQEKTFTTVYKCQKPDELNYVDLGLSVNWATCNIGASKPEEYGDYFAWGETQPKSDYCWSSYKYCKGSYDSMTKYCTDSEYGYNGFTDGKTVLDPADDAAHVNWGGSWRMPTRAEQDELRNNCTWTWTTMNGVEGYKVESRESVYEGNWIFLPAAGYRYDTYLSSVGSYGLYWSSSLSAGSPDYAYYLYFNSGYVDWYDDYRDYGRSVRPVCPKD